VIRRLVIDSDFEALWRLHVETMKAYVAATYGWDEGVQARMFRENWESRRSSELLEEDGDIVATWRIERRPHEHYLAFVEIAVAHQSRGHGTSIIQELITSARNAGVDASLMVMKANPRARQLYERLGFLAIEETPTHFRMVSKK
jgi:ribosomal protein S18 acetylase RimI-like enzyme